jgi:c-di-AMP phosphodiesterase-like protein
MNASWKKEEEEMRSKISRLQRILLAAVVVQAILLFIFRTGLKQGIMTAVVILIVEALLIVYLFNQFEDIIDEQSSGVKSILGSSSQEAYEFGQVGLVIYDDKYNITWMSDLFAQRGIDRVGDKLTEWLPESVRILSGDQDTGTVMLDDRVYEIRRKSDAPIMYFRDITDIQKYREKYMTSRLVIGMSSFDNYEESIQYADETEAAQINAAVRTPLTEYCQKHGILIKRVTSAKYLMVLNEKIFTELVRDHFSVLTSIRKASSAQDVSITLSMAFARGTDDLNELDSMVNQLMDLAKTRGGDQVAVQNYGEDVQYYGGSTEAAEKRSRVRVRVISHSLRELIMNASNVIICGHKNADFDCMGSAIALARMAKALKKQAVIIAKSGGLEEKLDACLKQNEEELSKEVTFVTESEALNQLKPNTLVIMTDHYSTSQSNGAKVAEGAKKVVIIDHHRRAAEMGVKPVLVYIEAGASSACELVTEMIPYVSSRTDLSALDATIMLTGMTIDTNHWHVRTGSRTYDAASVLRKFGADPQQSNAYLKDTYEEFNLKSQVVSSAQRYDHGIVIAPFNLRPITRSLMSQAADMLLEIQGVEAVFIIADSDHNETCISARSAGHINVQWIMEKMHGGGHLTAAAVQRPKTSIESMRKELLEAIDAYLDTETKEEDNT